MRSVVAAVFLVAFAGAAHSQSDTENCRILSGPISNAAQAARSFYDTLEGMDYGEAAGRFEGEEGERLLEANAARVAMLPDFEAFVSSLEEAEFAFRRCAR